MYKKQQHYPCHSNINCIFSFIVIFQPKGKICYCFWKQIYLATPLFSCKVTQAVLESDAIVMYSGSSAAKVALIFPTLNPPAVKCT
jgi:hypothetical protein